MTVARAARSPLKSGISTSTAHPGTRSRMRRMVAANTSGPAVGQVVAVHRGEHGVAQAEAGHRLGHPLRLPGVQRPRPARW